jgi:gliding motility-associated lipoprotein GldH
MKRVFQFKITSLLFFAFIIVLFISCDNQTIFEQYQKFEKQTWHRFNIIKFEVPINNSQEPYDLALIFRHLPEFRIKELPVNVTIYMPSGEMRSAESVIKFTDSQGVSLSECLGDLCDLSFTFRQGFVFPETGTVRIEIENKWPRIELPGILEVGLILKKVK